MAKRKIMYLNPVGLDTFDQLFADMASEIKLPDTEVHVTSLAPDYGKLWHIEYRAYEAVVTRGIVRAARQAAQEGFDALAIGCFYDTALHDARELSGNCLVTGPCIAACKLATSLSNRFGVIIGRRKWEHQMRSTILGYGYGENLSGFYSVGLGVEEFQADHERTGNRLMDAAQRAIAEGAESIILGCTMEIGFHRKMEAELGVPVIDVSMAALKDAEFAAEMKTGCGWTPSRKWSCEAPPEDELATLGQFDGMEVFGNRIVIPAAA